MEYVKDRFPGQKWNLITQGRLFESWEMKKRLNFLDMVFIFGLGIKGTLPFYFNFR
jgi:hypothetical protein